MRKRHWKTFTENELKEMVSKAKSKRDLARLIGYSQDSGSTARAINDMIEFYNFDISHFKSQNWNAENYNFNRFRYGNPIKSRYMRDALIYIRGYKCELCDREMWFNQFIPLEVHHINGNCLDNELANLTLLCPNCHESLREMHLGHLYIDKSNIPEELFKEALEQNNSIRKALISLGLTPKGGNYERAKKIINKYNIIIEKNEPYV